MAAAIQIPPEPTTDTLYAASQPIAAVPAGRTVVFTVGDDMYRKLSPDDLDAGRVDFRKVNRLTGPVWIEQAQPGDAIGFTVDSIELGPTAHVPFVARWRSQLFGLSASAVDRFPIEGDTVRVSDRIVIDTQPMIGCIAAAPATGTLSSLAPAGPTGGNLDLQSLQRGTTIWLPVEVHGALVALGDLHATMGAGEPFGAGLECSGTVTGRFSIAPDAKLSGPRLESSRSIQFVGCHRDSDFESQRIAIQSAMVWLTDTCDLSDVEARAIFAAAADLSLGGPAGHNHLVSFDLERLKRTGVRTSRLID